MRWRSRLGVRACLDLGLVTRLAHPVFSRRRLGTRAVIQRQHQRVGRAVHSLTCGAVDSGGTGRLRCCSRLLGCACLLDGLEVGAGQCGQRSAQRQGGDEGEQ